MSPADEAARFLRLAFLLSSHATACLALAAVCKQQGISVDVENKEEPLEDGETDALVQQSDETKLDRSKPLAALWSGLRAARFLLLLVWAISMCSPVFSFYSVSEQKQLLVSRVVLYFSVAAVVRWMPSVWKRAVVNITVLAPAIPFRRVQFAEAFAADHWCSLSFLASEVFFHVTASPFPELAALPFAVRFAQCVRQAWDEGKAFPSLLNALKYLCALAALWSGNKLLLRVVATSFAFSWDLLVDWRLMPLVRLTLGTPDVFNAKLGTEDDYPDETESETESDTQHNTDEEGSVDAIQERATLLNYSLPWRVYFVVACFNLLARFAWLLPLCTSSFRAAYFAWNLCAWFCSSAGSSATGVCTKVGLVRFATR
ncbi:MAG: hypothetical protein MHM6MM_006243 [Cercozoa sp. M6MM]